MADYEFKVGDKVRLVSTEHTESSFGFEYEKMGKIGDVFTILSIDGNSINVEECVDNCLYFNYHYRDFELANSNEIDRINKQSKPKKKVVQKFKRNIPSDMLKVWNKLRKTNDPQLLAEHCKVSYITAIRFLTYGYVSKRKNIKLINEYFINTRSEQEKDVNTLKKDSRKIRFLNIIHYL